MPSREQRVHAFLREQSLRTPPPSSEALDAVAEGRAEVAATSRPSLRLAVSRGALGIELDAPFRLGPIALTELSLSFPKVRFPVDLSGGVARFRHRRGELGSLRIEAKVADLAAWAAPRLDGLLGEGKPDVIVAPIEGGALVGVHREDRTLAFEVVAAPTGAGLCLLPLSARGVGLGVPAHVLALRALSILLRPHARLASGSVLVGDAVASVVREVLPSAGARAPSTEGTSWGSLETRVGTIVATLGRGLAPPRLSDRALSALELCELAGEADRLAFAGDLAEARARYLAALERAPRHPELCRRIASIDVVMGDRAEAALGTLVEAMAAVDAGVLGGELLQAVGDHDGARAAYARAAEAEPVGTLAALTWLRVAAIAPELDERLMALDRAVQRAPALPSARWARLTARLDVADLRGARGDAEHLEAAAKGPRARLEVWQRAAKAFLERGYVTEAGGLFERALRYAPEDVDAVRGLARSLRESGEERRALDLFARAVALAERKGQSADDASLDLARGLAELAGDLPAAIARVRAIAVGSALSLDARHLEGRWRAQLGDLAGSALAYSRLCDAVERSPHTIQDEGPRRPAEVAAMLTEAAESAERESGDLLAAQRALGLALRLRPRDRHITESFRRVSAILAQAARPARPAAPAAAPREPVFTPEPVTPEPPATSIAPTPAAPAPAAGLSDEDDEALAERLTDRLRASPSDHPTALALADVLTRLGRDMELLALLSARIEEGSAEVQADLAPRRREVLLRLAATSRAEGRASEAELYEMMAGSEDDT